MSEEDEFDEWAITAASQVVQHVERHGVGITWSEAHQALLQDDYLTGVISRDASNNGEPPGIAPQPRRREDPDFLESVACSRLHYEGRAYHPMRPDSEVPVGVSIHTIVAAHLRLSFLLQPCVSAPVPHVDSDRLAALVTELAYHLGGDHLMDIDDGMCHSTLDESVHVVLSAQQLLQAVRFLEAGEPAIQAALHQPPPLASYVLEELADLTEHRACILALRWWLGVS